jgi:hypothetical protein
MKRRRKILGIRVLKQEERWSRGLRVEEYNKRVEENDKTDKGS